MIYCGQNDMGHVLMCSCVSHYITHNSYPINSKYFPPELCQNPNTASSNAFKSALTSSSSSSSFYGPVGIRSGCTAALGLLCSPLGFHSALVH
jgi:hypothetical protein